MKLAEFEEELAREVPGSGSTLACEIAEHGSAISDALTYPQITMDSRDKNSKTSLLDYDDLQPLQYQELEEDLMMLFSKKNKDFNYLHIRDNIQTFTPELIEKFQQHIFPSAFSFVEEFLGRDFKKMLGDPACRMLATYAAKYPDCNLQSKDELIGFLNTEEKIIGFLQCLLNEKEAGETKETRILKARRKELFMAVYGMMVLYSEYKEIEPAFAEYEAQMEEFQDEIEAKYPGIKDKLYLSTRRKSDWSMISKLLRKKTINPEDIMADLFASRFVICVPTQEEAQEVALLVQKELYAKYHDTRFENLSFENRNFFSGGNFSELIHQCEQEGGDTQGKMFDIGYKDIKKYQTFKAEGDWRYTSHREDEEGNEQSRTESFGQELQYVRSGASNEDAFSAHTFYEAGRSTLFQLRQYVTTDENRIMEKVKIGLVKQYFKHEKNLEKLEGLPIGSLKGETIYKEYGEISFKDYEWTQGNKLMEKIHFDSNVGVILFDDLIIWSKQNGRQENEESTQMMTDLVREFTESCIKRGELESALRETTQTIKTVDETTNKTSERLEKVLLPVFVSPGHIETQYPKGFRKALYNELLFPHEGEEEGTYKNVVGVDKYLEKRNKSA